MSISRLGNDRYGVGIVGAGLFFCSQGKLCRHEVMITGVASKNIEAFVDLGSDDAEQLVGVATTNPVDAGVVGFPRDTGPAVTFESVEGHHARTIGMACRLPTIDKAVAAQGGVGGAAGCDIEVAHDDGGEVGEGGELGGDDVDGFDA